MSDIQRERGEDSASRFGFLLKRRLPLFLFFFLFKFQNDRIVLLYCTNDIYIYIYALFPTYFLKLIVLYALLLLF